MRSTFQNSGTALSIVVFFSLMNVGLAKSLPTPLTRGLQRQGVSSGVAHHSDSPETAIHDHVSPEPGDIVGRSSPGKRM
jgi:hypothetical protein